MKQLCTLTLFFTFFSLPLLSQSTPSVKINELMASNSAAVADPDFGEYGDWVELFNTDSLPADISGYYLTDNFSQPQKWRLPLTGVIIPAQGYLIIWCDDHNTGLHANFKLSASGEVVGLYAPNGSVVDSVSFGQQETDISFGRFPDGENDWYNFFPSTPGLPNYEDNITSKCPEPEISLQPGFYPAPVTVSLSTTMGGAEVRYTTDGSEPRENSNLYSAPIQIDSTTVLRAKTFKLQSFPSKTVTGTYFINFNSSLPVFSLSTDPANFFSDSAGIYVTGTNGITGYCSSIPRNWNQDWERPISLEFFEEDKSRAFAANAGVKIYGGCTRLYDEKSLGVYFRDRYGDSKIYHKIFKDSYLYEFNNLVLRNAGQDWYRTMIREGMINALIKGRMMIDQQEYRPSILFINGRYWGIHNIREKLNEHYLYYHYNIPEDQLDLIEFGSKPDVKAGDSVAYYQMYNFLKYHDISIDTNYQVAKSMIDIDQYIDYNIIEIFAANGDWPANNTKLFRDRRGGKWRWLLYDLDYCYNGNSEGMYNTNTLKYMLDSVNTISTSPAWATMIFRRLMANQEFRNEFTQRMAAHMSSTFDYNRTMSIIDSVRNLVADEIPRHKARWTKSISFGSSWTQQIQLIRDFAQQRASKMRSFFYDWYGIPGAFSVTLTTNDSTAGRLIAHTVNIPWNTKPIFFKSIPLKLWAMPNPGYRFVRWEGFVNQTGEKLELLPNQNIALKAIFEPAESTDSNLVINEINYKSSSLYDTGDWVEFYNPSPDSVNISGYKFYDSSDNPPFVFPEGSVIPPLGYFTVCQDTAKFKFFHEHAENYTGNFAFGLSSSGETVYIADPADRILDSVAYSSTAPWDPKANGDGFTLALINPELDNNLADSWKAGKKLGTPSARNDVYTKIHELKGDVPSSFSMSQNFPNPFNPETKILVTLPENCEMKLTVYDALGTEVEVLAKGDFAAGSYEFFFSGAKLASGVYFYRISAGNYSEVKKMLLLR